MVTGAIHKVSRAIDGYTYVRGTGTNTDISQPVFDETDKTATVDLFYLDTGGTVEIHYGAFDGGRWQWCPRTQGIVHE